MEVADLAGNAADFAKAVRETNTLDAVKEGISVGGNLATLAGDVPVLKNRAGVASRVASGLNGAVAVGEGVNNIRQTMDEKAAFQQSTAIASADSRRFLVEELAGLRMKMAEKVKLIERVPLLDPTLGAHLEASLSGLNARIKNAEIALARQDDEERDRRDIEKLKLVQDHEVRMVERQHRNQKELTRLQQDLVRVPQSIPAEKDLLELMADGLDASASFQAGVQQLQSTDTATQADGLRKINGAFRQMK